ncbi:hypothetical protein Q0812_13390 [Brevundimonas sp. 2R-24]|uniref:Uncharacterized protein n=1 Tax=Peiella sedimenti TaxID=3061083 RepID=A0ABT8SRE1_9CAUL|nr:hypothetical protein [Caulobacteraceae bacterium XZ-24]
MAYTQGNTRRSLFAIGAGAAALATVPAIAVALPSENARWSDAVGEARAICAMQDEVDLSGDEALVDEWERREAAFLRAIEALPNTPENAKYRALAVRVIHHGDPEWEYFSDYSTRRPTNHRLAIQMVEALTAGAF